MNKEFIPYEQALALKELGFHEPCFGYFNTNNRELFLDNSNNRTSNDDDRWCSAPTFSQAFRWFREKCSIFSSVDINYCYKIYVNDEFFEESINYNSYEEAELECLKKLIEIVKQ